MSEYDLRKYSFSDRIIDIWNSQLSFVISAWL